MLPFLDRSSPRLDPDAVTFAGRSGATDVRGLSDWFKGLKRLGVWNDIVFWPKTAGHCAGTGTTLHSAGGLGQFDGTLVNGPTWGNTGLILIRGSSQHVTTALANPSNQKTLLSAFNQTNSAFYDSELSFGGGAVALSANNSASDHGLTSPGLSVAGANVAAPFGQFNFVGASHDGINTTIANGTTIATGALGATPGVTGTLAIGMHNTGVFYQGTIAFSGVVQRTLTGQEINSIAALYKSTLGKGLGLP